MASTILNGLQRGMAALSLGGVPPVYGPKWSFLNPRSRAGLSGRLELAGYDDADGDHEDVERHEGELHAGIDQEAEPAGSGPQRTS